METSKNNSLSLKDVTDSLKILVKEGKIWANCPKCQIPLSLKEYNKSKCNTCGKFHINDLKFYPKKAEIC